MAPESPAPITFTPDGTLEGVLAEAIGAASMCWEHVDRAGVFNDTRARAVHEALIATIRTRWPDAPLTAS